MTPDEPKPEHDPQTCPLAFATDDELWGEWMRRWPRLVIVGERDTQGGPSDDLDVITRWHGGMIASLGLLDYARIRISNHMATVVPVNEHGERLDGEDDE